MILDKIEKIIPKERIFLNEPMSKHTTFKIGGKAKIFIKINSVQELQNLLKIIKEDNIKVLIIGNGSNILVCDEGFDGIVLKIEIKKFVIQEDNSKFLITLGTGNKLGEIAYKLADKNISGFEFASGIPGTVGGAIRMNAGAYGSEMKDIVNSITYMDRNGQISKITNKEAKFEYRNSIFSKKDYIIIETEIELESGKKEEIIEQNRINEQFKRPETNYVTKKNGESRGSFDLDTLTFFQ